MSNSASVSLGKRLYLRFVRWCPGALGFILRRRFYPHILGYCGKKVIFGRFLDFSPPENISIGDNVIINNFVSIIAGVNTSQCTQIVLEKNVFLGSFCRLSTGNGGKIILREGANIGSSCYLQSNYLLEVGRDTLLAGYCHLGLSDDGANSRKDRHTHKTRVGESCWLGVRVQQVEGTKIGKESIVGAHSFVINDLPDYCIAMGIPAEVKRRRQDMQKCH
jgi:acetyltransferase-like isoleucine patch superfamily enzyme